ncbi:MAG: alpha/beta hydrolase [Pseudomonadota bacterium]
MTVKNGDVSLNVAVQGEGPLILMIHGWPELWYSWRHQISHFARLGYKVAAMDVRGYGASSKPHKVKDYTLRHLTADAAAVIDALGGGEAIVFGHDWGANIAWATALLYPEKVKGVAGLSVVYTPPSDRPVTELFKELFPDSFFYITYFQQEGPPEAELEADIRGFLRKTYYAGSGDVPTDQIRAKKPADAKFLDGMVDPDPFPAWMPDADLDVFVRAYEAGGLRGPLNLYRAWPLNTEELKDYRGAFIKPPAFFIGGERDTVRHFVPGMDLYDMAGAACEDFRGSVIVPGAGHWIQQEAPEATTAALENFVKEL